MDLLQKFNDTFGEFVDDLVSVFPEDPEFRMYQTAIKAAMCIDKNIANNVFHEYVVTKYGDKLIARDEGFFLSHDYKDVTSSAGDNNTLALISKIKSYWVDMNEDNRKIIWKYFKVLILLDKKIQI